MCVEKGRFFIQESNIRILTGKQGLRNQSSCPRQVICCFSMVEKNVLSSPCYTIISINLVQVLNVCFSDKLTPMNNVCPLLNEWSSVNQRMYTLLFYRSLNIMIENRERPIFIYFIQLMSWNKFHGEKFNFGISLY